MRKTVTEYLREKQALAPVLPKTGRKQPATVVGRMTHTTENRVRVSSAFRLASDSRREQIYCFLSPSLPSRQRRRRAMRRCYVARFLIRATALNVSLQPSCVI